MINSPKALEGPKKIHSDELAKTICLPLEPSRKIYLRTNIPLNRCNAYSLSASVKSLPVAWESAVREEQMAWQRQQLKLQKVEEFLRKTRYRVNLKKSKEKEEAQNNSRKRSLEQS